MTFRQWFYRLTRYYSQGGRHYFGPMGFRIMVGHTLRELDLMRFHHPKLRYTRVWFGVIVRTGLK